MQNCSGLSLQVTFRWPSDIDDYRLINPLQNRVFRGKKCGCLAGQEISLL